MYVFISAMAHNALGWFRRKPAEYSQGHARDLHEPPWALHPRGVMVHRDHPPLTPRALALHRALRRMAGLAFLLIFWALAGACQRHGVGGVYRLSFNSSSSSAAEDTPGRDSFFFR